MSIYIYIYIYSVYSYTYIHTSTNQSGAVFTCRNNNYPRFPTCAPAFQCSLNRQLGHCRSYQGCDFFTQLTCRKRCSCHPAGRWHAFFIQSLDLKIQGYSLKTALISKKCIEMLDGIIALGGAGPKDITSIRPTEVLQLRGWKKVITVVRVAILFILPFSTEYWQLYNQMFVCVHICLCKYRVA